MNKLRKSMVAAGLSAGLVGGGAAGLILGSPVVAGADEASLTAPRTGASQDPPPEGAEAEADTPGERDPEDAAARKSHRDAERAEHLRSVLEPLIQDGTMSQAQVDAAVKAIVAAAPPHPMGRRAHRFRAAMKTTAEVLGLTPGELGKRIMGGRTIAEIAESEGVDPQKVIDSLISDLKTLLDEGVEDGRITRQQADERLDEATEAITEGVDSGSLDRLLGRLFRMGNGINRHRGDDPAVPDGQGDRGGD